MMTYKYMYNQQLTHPLMLAENQMLDDFNPVKSKGSSFPKYSTPEFLLH